MKKILFLMLLCLPFIAMAQTDPKYLAGAITMNDGKVSFNTGTVFNERPAIWHHAEMGHRTFQARRQVQCTCSLHQ